MSKSTVKTIKIINVNGGNLSLYEDYNNTYGCCCVGTSGGWNISMNTLSVCLNAFREGYKELISGKLNK